MPMIRTSGLPNPRVNPGPAATPATIPDPSKYFKPAVASRAVPFAVAKLREIARPINLRVNVEVAPRVVLGRPQRRREPKAVGQLLTKLEIDRCVIGGLAKPQPEVQHKTGIPLLGATPTKVPGGMSGRCLPGSCSHLERRRSGA